MKQLSPDIHVAPLGHINFLNAACFAEKQQIPI